MTSTSGVHRRPRVTAFQIDLLIAVIVLVVVEAGLLAELWFAPAGDFPLAVAFPAGAFLLGLAASAAIVVRRRYPLLVSVVVIVVFAAYHFVGYPGASPALVLFVSSYSLAAYGTPTRRSIVLAIGFIVVFTAIPAFPPHPLPWYSFAVSGPALGMAWMVAFGATAAQVRRNNALSVAAAATEAEARMREQLTDERLGMARELHDVLAHTISVISVQAGVALDALDDHPDAARTAMIKVRGLSRQAIPELHRTLELLRRDSATTDEVDPQPRLDRLGDLLADVEASGLTVEAHVAIDGSVLSPFVELTAYRIVQEALTNVVRHASATSAVVVVRADQESKALVVSVADNGRGAAPAERGGRPAGLGLVGMRERANSVGGTLTTGTSPSGGFLVSAVLPIEVPV